jgi:hypothetical protein
LLLFIREAGDADEPVVEKKNREIGEAGAPSARDFVFCCRFGQVGCVDNDVILRFCGDASHQRPEGSGRHVSSGGTGRQAVEWQARTSLRLVEI